MRPITMDNRLVHRADLACQIIHALNNPEIQVVHLWGMAGSGKSILLQQCTQDLPEPCLVHFCQRWETIDPEKFVRDVARSTLSPRKNNIFLKKWNSTLTNRQYKSFERRTSYSLTIENSELNVQGDLIVGCSEKDAEEERERSFSRATVGAEVLASRKELGDGGLLYVFENYHDLQDSRFVKWINEVLLYQELMSFIRLKLVFVSRARDTIQCPVHSMKVVTVGPFCDKEAHESLKNCGIESESDRVFLIRLCHAHPLALMLSADAFKHSDLSELEIPEVSGKVYEELCVKVLWARIIETEPNRKLAVAILHLALYRVFTADAVRHLCECSVREAEEICHYLSSRGYVERVGPMMKYHDLLRDLSLRYLPEFCGSDEVRRLHKRAAQFFLNWDPEPPLQLVKKVEPFYHFLHGSLDDAVKYSEALIKPALDRRKLADVEILLKQIDFDLLPEDNRKAWLMLRYGGYFRELRRFSLAIKIFNEITEMSIQNDLLNASVLNNLGWCYLYSKENEWDRAMQFFQSSNKICRANNFVDILAMNLNNMGIALARQTTKSPAAELEYYAQSLAITESDQSPNPLVAAMSYRNAGLACQQSGDLEKAEAFLLRSLERYKNANAIQGQGQVAYLLAGLLESRRDYEQARKLLDIAIAIQMREETADPYYYGESLFALSRVLDKLEEYDGMQNCLASMPVISLRENFEYHATSVRHVIAYLTYLRAAHGRDIVDSTANRIKEVWVENAETREITQFLEFLQPQVDALLSSQYWSIEGSSIYHQCGSSSCKPRKWYRVRLHPKESDKVSSMRGCKKCFQ